MSAGVCNNITDCLFQLFFSTLMMLIDRGFLTMPRGGDDINLNDERAVGFEFLKSLIQPFVEGVWVS